MYEIPKIIFRCLFAFYLVNLLGPLKIKIFTKILHVQRLRFPEQNEIRADEQVNKLCQTDKTINEGLDNFVIKSSAVLDFLSEY